MPQVQTAKSAPATVPAVVAPQKLPVAAQTPQPTEVELLPSLTEVPLAARPDANLNGGLFLYLYKEMKMLELTAIDKLTVEFLIEPEIICPDVEILWPKVIVWDLWMRTEKYPSSPSARFQAVWDGVRYHCTYVEPKPSQAEESVN